MNSRSDLGGFGLLIASIVLFGGLAVVLYAMGLTEVAVVPTIGAVAAAAVAIQRALRSPAVLVRGDATRRAPLERDAGADSSEDTEDGSTSEETAA